MARPPAADQPGPAGRPRDPRLGTSATKRTIPGLSVGPASTPPPLTCRVLQPPPALPAPVAMAARQPTTPAAAHREEARRLEVERRELDLERSKIEEEKKHLETQKKVGLLSNVGELVEQRNGIFWRDLDSRQMCDWMKMTSSLEYAKFRRMIVLIIHFLPSKIASLRLHSLTHYNVSMDVKYGLCEAPAPQVLRLEAELEQLKREQGQVRGEGVVHPLQARGEGQPRGEARGLVGRVGEVTRGVGGRLGMGDVRSRLGQVGGQTGGQMGGHLVSHMVSQLPFCSEKFKQGLARGGLREGVVRERREEREEREGQGRSGAKRRYRAGAALPEELVLTELTKDGPVRKEDAVGRVLAREDSEEEEEEERSSRKRQWR